MVYPKAADIKFYLDDYLKADKENPWRGKDGELLTDSQAVELYGLDEVRRICWYYECQLDTVINNTVYKIQKIVAENIKELLESGHIVESDLIAHTGRNEKIYSSAEQRIFEERLYVLDESTLKRKMKQECNDIASEFILIDQIYKMYDSFYDSYKENHYLINEREINIATIEAIEQMLLSMIRDKQVNITDPYKCKTRTELLRHALENHCKDITSEQELWNRAVELFKEYCR